MSCHPNIPNNMKGRALSLENHADFHLDECRHDNRLGF
jgi:hypothetical protein